MKLAELRAKTDRQLAKLIRTQLEVGLALASVASSRQSALHSRAQNLYSDASALLARAYGLAGEERPLLAAKLKELRVALDRVPSQCVQQGAA